MDNKIAILYYAYVFRIKHLHQCIVTQINQSNFNLCHCAVCTDEGVPSETRMHNIELQFCCPFRLISVIMSFQGFSCISVISTLASIICWYLIWQNLSHTWGSFCQLWGHIPSVARHFAISPSPRESLEDRKSVPFTIIINYIQNDGHIWSQ